MGTLRSTSWIRFIEEITHNVPKEVENRFFITPGRENFLRKRQLKRMAWKNNTRVLSNIAKNELLVKPRTPKVIPADVYRVYGLPKVTPDMDFPEDNLKDE